MIHITENSNTKDTSYNVKTYNKKKLVEEHDIHCKTAVIKKDNKDFFLLFDRNYKLIQDAFNYINIYMDGLKKSYQTKEKTLVSLKLLYSYLEIFNIDLKRMTNDDASRLITFLIGQSVSGNDVSFEFKAVRTPSSVNDYLSIMRGYVTYLKYNTHPLLSTGGKRKITSTLDGNIKERKPYAVKVKEYHKTQIPKHVKLEEFKTMQKYLHDKEDIQLESIIRLMYESGLRSGEVLALTYEDLKISEVNGQIIYKVILRNRVGNPVDRSPKFLMKVKSKKDYTSKAYLEKGFGWNEMMISKSLYEMILDCIENIHTNAMEKHNKNWKKYTIADSVDPEFKEKENFFIFLNKYGKPLSRKTLEAQIKQLFIDCGVKIDKDGGKYDGLCHRFRHGFAMYQVNYNQAPISLLKELMRHNNIESTSVYYTPEASDIIKIKDDLSKSVYEYIPEFNLNKEDK